MRTADGEQWLSIIRTGMNAVIDCLSRTPEDESDVKQQAELACGLLSELRRANDVLTLRLGKEQIDGLSESPQATLHLPTPAPFRARGYEIDLAFIAQLEGNVTRGYVPTHRGKVIGHSGVTIGMGVDLGQRDERALARLRLMEELINKLRPYLGAKGEAARQILAEHPLSLTQEEAQQLSAEVAAAIFDRLSGRYNLAVAPRAGCRFEDLPPQAQTVIASVAYQYGDNLPKATPRFWSCVTKMDWASAVSELEYFGDEYGPRRRQEAHLLRELL